MDEEHRQPAPPDSTPAFFGWLFIVCGISFVIDQRLIGETGVVTNFTPLEAWVYGGVFVLVGLRFVVYYYRAKRRARRR